MIQTEPEDIKRIRERLRKMSDLELRQYGRAARDLSNPKKNFGPPNPSFQIQLDEASGMEKTASCPCTVNLHFINEPVCAQALRTSQTIRQMTNNVPSIPYPNMVSPIERCEMATS